MIANRRLALVLLLPAAACFGSRGLAHDTVTPGRSCGALSLWSLQGDVVTSTASDTRSIDTMRTQARIDLIALAAEAYCSVQGTYPSGYEAMLDFKSRIPARLSNCALADDLLDDAWQRPIYYAVQGSHVQIVSAGPDGRFTTADDITLPQPADPLAEVPDLARECAPRARPSPQGR
jgi:hypothetical protein